MNSPSPTLAQRAEAALVKLLANGLRALPPQAASSLGGAVAGALGPLIPTTKVADRNLRFAMPELSAAQRKAIIKDVWRNLGHTVGELARLRDIREISASTPGPGYIVEGWDENITPAIAKGGPAIFITGHLGNWEITPRLAVSRGLDFGFMYRAAGNPLVDEAVRAMRLDGAAGPILMFPKGAAGARAAYGQLLKGACLGLLVDQKLDSGIAAPFFGKPAMTMDALAAFALKFRCPVMPVHTVRLAPARLKIICEAPMRLPDSGDKQADTLTLTTEMNLILERWIRENPGSWLWLHRRWPKGTA